ncbi:major facilitator superfamily domain-containing protein [Thelonectria olida]|uniref:Major facilitator superfamily domain-containing protein n=1 Tax=Thelonectria olida TaxID=1576542 RepID=A0A9P8W100_9HYPO|nr:major facilitator superfamily domain-containing protein [Thelonectria olida]
MAGRPWWKIRWFADADSPKERKLIVKLDLLIVPYVFLAYWVKYIDQSNLNNAYVSGMKEDLGLYGNELVQFQTMYTVGAVVGQLPFMFLLTHVPLQWLIPTVDVLWGLFTLLQFRATKASEVMGYRFLVGFFEAAFYPSIHYMFGCWYRKDEISRRAGIFYNGTTLGVLTAGLIQAGTSARLHNVNGLAGWRWMYIICAVITIPVGILGIFVIPGTPAMPNRLVLSQADIDLSTSRLKSAGHTTSEKFQWKSLRQVIKNPIFWALLFVMTLFWNSGGAQGSGAYLLWLRSLDRYSIPRVNELGTLQPVCGIFFVLAIAFASDLLVGPVWALTAGHVFNIVGLAILLVWDVPEGVKWFAFMTNFSAASTSTVVYGWVNHVMRHSPAQRAITLIIGTAWAQSSTAWIGLLTYPTVEAPRFTKGFAFGIAMSATLILLSHPLSWWINSRE